MVFAMDQMQKAWIEHRAQELLKKMWFSLPAEERPKGESVEELLQFFDPHRVAAFLEINVEVRDTLGRFGDHRERFEVAAVLDRSRNLIGLSEADSFSARTMRFTMAHELGHWILHTDQVNFHRDRPVEGVVRSPRPPLEQEADHFAACLLMPRKLLQMAFQRRFGKPPLVMNDHTAFSLAVGNPSFLLKAEYGALERQLAVATAGFFNGVKFDSLASLFRVSPSSMAIQLREFGLVPDWP